MICREYVVAFINKQLDYMSADDIRKKGNHHYGRVELKDLLDFIYGRLPEGTLEEIK